MDIKNTTNPVGVAHEVEAVEAHLNAMAATWDEQQATEEKAPWWKFWKGLGTTQVIKVTNFLIKSLDDLIALVDDELQDGADKKATVINGISRLYDYVIREALPIWMKPFATPVKNYIIDGLISSAIDWIVDKYRNGEWRKKLPEPIPMPEQRLL